jgi:YHS domain-containing protein
VVVEENGRVIVDASVTDRISSGIDYYRLYRSLGVFSDEVLAQLKGISGFPLEAEICVVTGKLKGHHNLEIKVKAVGKDDLPPEAFNVPKGWTLEKEEPLKAPCANRSCEKEVEPRNLPVGGRKFRYRGTWRYFCSRKCYNEFRRRHRTARPKRRPMPPRQSPKTTPTKGEKKAPEKK